MCVCVCVCVHVWVGEPILFPLMAWPHPLPSHGLATPSSLSWLGHTLFPLMAWPHPLPSHGLATPSSLSWLGHTLFPLMAWPHPLPSHGLATSSSPSWLGHTLIPLMAWPHPHPSLVHTFKQTGTFFAWGIPSAVVFTSSRWRTSRSWPTFRKRRLPSASWPLRGASLQWAGPCPSPGCRASSP